MQEKLYFYYTNDLHSDFTYWPQVARFLKQAKTDKEACWIADIGDHIDRVHPIAEAFMGKANVDLMNDVGYDVVTLGNNEGITLAHDDLHHLYDNAQFEIVCANLTSERTYSPEWLKSMVHVESKGSLKIGFIGLTAPFNAFYELLGWHVAYPFEVLQDILKYAREACDVIVLLSHLGIHEDREIARHFPEIDAIIGGHTHHLLRTGETVNETIITAAGKHCAYVGEVILTWDFSENRLISKEAYTTNMTHWEKDGPTVERLQQWQTKANKQLESKVIYTSEPIEVQWFKETEVTKRLAHTLKEWTKADCALLNAGLLLESFPEGMITYKDVHRVCPHPINPCTVKLSGRELLEVIRVSFTKDLTELPLKGFGFRGKVIGKIIFAGLSVETTTDEQGEERVTQVCLEGESGDKPGPLKKENVYTLATIDTFTFGRLLPEIAKATTKTFYLPEFMRDLLRKTLVEQFASEK